MSDMITAIASYAKEIKARIEGDTAGIISEGNARVILAEVNNQISTNSGELSLLEIDLLKIKAKRTEAMFPTKELGRKSSFVADMLLAEVDVKKVEKEIRQTQANLDYWNNFKEERFSGKKA